MSNSNSSRSPQRSKCNATTKAGKPCRAYAVHGERFCSAHLGLNVGAGAPAGNQNAKKHGFYADSFTVDELVGVMDMSGEVDLGDEVAMLRVLNRRVMRWLSNEAQRGELVATDLHRLLTALSASSRTIAKLLKDIEGTGDGDGGMDDVLDALAEELGITV